MFDGRTRLALDVVNEVRKFFPNQVFQTIIPRSIRLAEAPSYGQPISIYAPEFKCCQSLLGPGAGGFGARRDPHTSS